MGQCVDGAARLALRHPCAIVAGNRVLPGCGQSPPPISFEVSSLPIAFRLLTVLLAAIPALAIAQETFARHVAAFAAATILAVAAMAPQADMTTATHCCGGFRWRWVFPILWMVLQLFPLSSLANPIWSTTSIALGEPSLPGHISIDLGTTLRSLMAYLTVLALMVSAPIVARDRQRAETVFSGPERGDNS